MNRLVLHSRRLRVTQPLFPVSFILGVVAPEKRHVAVAGEGDDVCGDTIRTSDRVNNQGGNLTLNEPLPVRAGFPRRGRWGFVQQQYIGALAQ